MKTERNILFYTKVLNQQNVLGNSIDKLEVIIEKDNVFTLLNVFEEDTCLPCITYEDIIKNGKEIEYEKWEDLLKDNEEKFDLKRILETYEKECELPREKLQKVIDWDFNLKKELMAENSISCTDTYIREGVFNVYNRYLIEVEGKTDTDLERARVLMEFAQEDFLIENSKLNKMRECSYPKDIELTEEETKERHEEFQKYISNLSKLKREKISSEQYYKKVEENISKLKSSERLVIHTRDVVNKPDKKIMFLNEKEINGKYEVGLKENNSFTNKTYELKELKELARNNDLIIVNVSNSSNKKELMELLDFTKEEEYTKITSLSKLSRPFYMELGSCKSLDTYFQTFNNINPNVKDLNAVDKIYLTFYSILETGSKMYEKDTE